MKKLFVILGITIIVLSSVALPAWAAPLAEEQPVFDIQLSPEIPYPGQEVVVTVQVDNYAAVAETLAEVEITLEGMTDSTTDEPPSDTLNFNDQGEATFSFYAPTESKIYEIKVKLTYGAGQFEESFSLAVETALPDSFARVFSGLGLFAAVMAIMAVGTEVVIEMFKSMLGLKAKPTAMNALEQLKSEIPGAIAGLGIDASRRKDLENLIEGIKTQIKPLDDITVFANAIRGGDFRKAAELLDQMTEAKDQKAFDDLKSQSVQALKEGFAVLYKKIPSTKSYLVHTETDILAVIENAKLKDVAALLDKFYPKFKEVGNTIANFSAEISAEWLRSQVNTLIRSGRQEVDSQTNELLRTLEGIGFSESDIAFVKEDLARKIDNLENLALDKASVYSTAVKNLLLELEKSRNAIQSPVRNYVRKLRESKRPLWKTIVVTLVVFFALVAIYAVLLLLKGIEIDLPRTIGWTVGVGLLVSAIILALVNIGMPEKIPGSGDKNPGSFNRATRRRSSNLALLNVQTGTALRYSLERNFNQIIDRDSSDEAVKHYGDVDAKIKAQIDEVTPTSLAGIVLSLESSHQEQETMRLRYIRIISIIIGTILAYSLKVDAAAYLNYTIPGIQNQINFVDLSKILPLLPSDLTVGILLTGFAASAGSRFWRDLLTRLKETRDTAEEAARLVQKVKSLLPSEVK